MRQQMFDYFSAQSGALTLVDVVLSFLVALVLGIVIFVSYRFSFSGAIYSVRFNVSLIMLTVITTLVMAVIGNNIALSLGMVGALSIVRFRTAIKDPRDTAYIFWCIAIGICCGVSEFMIASIGTMVLFLFLILVGAVRRNDRYMLIVRGAKEGSSEIEKRVTLYFNSKAQLRVINTGTDTVEYIYELTDALLASGKKRSQNALTIVETLEDIAGINAINLVCQNDEINR